MRAITATQHEPEIERNERQSDALVLLDVPPLVAPQRIARLARSDDHVSEGDRRVTAHRDKHACEAAIGDVEEAAVTDAWPRERQQPDEMAEWIGVVTCQEPPEIS